MSEITWTHPPFVDLQAGAPWWRAIAPMLEAKVIHTDGDPYMTRYLLREQRGMSIYRHQFHREDRERATHDHPWPFWHLILEEGGYVESTAETRYKHRWYQERKPGYQAFHYATYKHRVARLRALPCWSLVAGDRIRKWGFDCPDGWVAFKDRMARGGICAGRGLMPIISAHTLVGRCRATGRLLPPVTVICVTRETAQAVAVVLMADHEGLSAGDIEVVSGVVEIAGLVSNPGEDFRERGTLAKLARGYQRRFQRMSDKQREMVMPAVLKAICPGMAIIRTPRTPDARGIAQSGDVRDSRPRGRKQREVPADA